MTYQIAFEQRPDFLQATVTGANAPSTVAGYLEDVVRECVRRDCHRLLVIECLEGPRLGVDEVFTLASEGAIRVMGFFDAVAFVDEQMGEMAQFAETVAINRGMPVKAFANVGDAESWLNGVGGGSELGQTIFHGSRDAEGEGN